MTMKIKHTFRPTCQYSKGYFTRLCEQYAHAYIPEEDWPKISIVEFTKQDMRGAFSITFFNQDNIPEDTRFFATKSLMQSFMEGFLVAKGIRS